MDERDQQTGDPWMLPSIGLVVGVAAALVPMNCTASLNDAHYTSAHGGAVVGGAIAIVLAVLAMMRGRRRGAAGIFALVVAGLGAASLAVGVLSMKRVPSAAESVDLDGPVRRVFEAMRDDQIDRIPGAGDATPDQIDAIRRLGRGYARGLGRWQDISGLQRKSSAHDTVVATGTAHYERGTPAFEITFVVVAGEPHLRHFDLTIPPSQLPPIADAEKAARQLTADVAAGAIDRVHDDLAPIVNLSPAFDQAIAKLAPLVATPPAIELVSHTSCDGGECFELRFPLQGGSQRVRITETSTFGIWLASSITLGDG